MLVARDRLLEMRREWTLVITARDEMVMCPFDKIDSALLEECRKSGLVSDQLLALELIARHIERGLASGHEPNATKAPGRHD